jgi:hypothetical protein
MNANANVTVIPTILDEAFLLASGINSAKTIQTIAPAAMPNPIGRNGAKAVTARYAGTAING